MKKKQDDDRIYGLTPEQFTDKHKQAKAAEYKRNAKQTVPKLAHFDCFDVDTYPDLGKTVELPPVPYGKRLFPLFNTINIETTSWCNFKCKFCPAAFLDRPHNAMSDDVYTKIIDELAAIDYTGDIKLHQSNEPMTDPKIYERVEYAREKTVCPVGFYSNGFKIDRLALHKLYKAGLNFLGVEAYVSKKQFDELLKIFMELRDFHDDVTVHYQTEDGGYSYADVKGSFKRRGMYITLSRRYPKRDDDADKFFEYNKSKITSRCGVLPSRMSTKATNMCVRPFRKMQVNWDGKVVLCCEEWLYNKGAMMGDLKKNSIVEVWNGKPFFEMRHMLQNHKRDKYPCNQCNFNGGTWATNVRRVKL